MTCKRPWGCNAGSQMPYTTKASACLCNPAALLSFTFEPGALPPTPPSHLPTLVMQSTEPPYKPTSPLHWQNHSSPCTPSPGYGICREAGKLEGERIHQQAVEEVEQLKQKVTHPATAFAQLSCMSACSLSDCHQQHDLSRLHSQQHLRFRLLYKQQQVSLVS